MRCSPRSRPDHARRRGSPTAIEAAASPCRRLGGRGSRAALGGLPRAMRAARAARTRRSRSPAYLAYRAPATVRRRGGRLPAGRRCNGRTGGRASLLDVGAGPGVATWAALEAWPSLEGADAGRGRAGDGRGGPGAAAGRALADRRCSAARARRARRADAPASSRCRDRDLHRAARDGLDRAREPRLGRPPPIAADALGALDRCRRFDRPRGTASSATIARCGAEFANAGRLRRLPTRRARDLLRGRAPRRREPRPLNARRGSSALRRSAPAATSSIAAARGRRDRLRATQKSAEAVRASRSRRQGDARASPAADLDWRTSGVRRARWPRRSRA